MTEEEKPKEPEKIKCSFCGGEHDLSSCLLYIAAIACIS